MIIPFEQIYKKYNMNIHGILHVGAHKCEELDAYIKHKIPKEKILWIEGNPDLVNDIKKNDNDIFIINALITDKDNEKQNFNIANNGESSSILEFGTHAFNYHYIKYVDSKTIHSKRLETVYKENNIPENFANFLNVDIQGAELLAFKSLGNVITNFDYIYTEVNSEEVYKGCALITDIDQYLANYGFKRVETVWVNTILAHLGWGDALYVKT